MIIRRIGIIVAMSGRVRARRVDFEPPKLLQNTDIVPILIRLDWCARIPFGMGRRRVFVRKFEFLTVFSYFEWHHLHLKIREAGVKCCVNGLLICIVLAAAVGCRTADNHTFSCHPSVAPYILLHMHNAINKVRRIMERNAVLLPMLRAVQLRHP